MCRPFAVPDPSTLKPPRDDPITLDELRAFDGTDPKLPIYVAMKGIVFDVTSKRDVYGPGGISHLSLNVLNCRKLLIR